MEDTKEDDLDNFTTIRITKRTLYRLKEVGRKGESYEDVLNDLMNNAYTGEDTR